MSTAKAVMETAQNCLGTKEYPPGSNNVVYNSDYYGHAVSGDDFPWCCVFVWDVFRMAHASDLFYGGRKTAYCPTYESWALSKGLSVGKGNGRYGDVATMDFGKGRASHIGFILAKLSDGTYQTIEGNTSVTSDDNGGAVMVRVRPQSVIRYIFRPQYSEGYLSIGDAGPDVAEMQKLLNAVGFNCGAVDGSFGDVTDKALRAFQKAEGLEVDGKYGIQSKTALERKYRTMAKFTRDQWINAVRNVYLMAHNNHYTYGDSTTTPPCAPPQKLISCDRLEARALWDLGLTDQRKGGEVCSTFSAWLEKHGAKKITDRNKLEGGDIIFVDDGTGGSVPTWRWHMFTIIDYDKKTQMCHKYDMGSNERIRATQPFYCKLEDKVWGGSKRFRFAYRMPYAGGPYSGTYRIESSVDRDFCVDVAKASTANKANIQLYKKNGTQAQIFNLEYVMGGYYRIVNIKSGKAIDVSGAKIINRRNIWQYELNGTKAQLWKPVKNSDGSFTFESALKSDYVMDLSGAKAVNKRNIHLYKKNGTNAQRWFLVKV